MFKRVTAPHKSNQMPNHESKDQSVKYMNVFQETMNDALTDLVRDMNKFRGQVEKKRSIVDIVNILQIYSTFHLKGKIYVCCSLEKRETSLVNQMRK